MVAIARAREIGMANVVNTNEQEFWSGPSGQSWVTYEAAQDEVLSEALGAVMDRVGLSAGDRAIDIGCGTGALSVAAARAVGDTGRLLATDISSPMLDRAKERLREFPQAGTLLADAESVDWPETGFDAAISRFGVMFFGNPPQAFANIARALKPGGRMVFAAWGPAAKNPYWRDPPRIARERVGSPPRVSPNTPGPMGMADKDCSLEWLRAAGLSDIACEEVKVGLPLKGTPEDAANQTLVIGPAARVIKMFETTEDDLAAIRDGIARELSQYHDGDTVRIPALLYLYTATVG